jgi:hypothetical protein
MPLAEMETNRLSGMMASMAALAAKDDKASDGGAGASDGL